MTAATSFIGGTEQQGVQRLSTPILLGGAVQNRSSPYDATRQVDEALLRHLAELLGRLSAVARASLFPANKQESLVVAFDTAPYPGPVEAVQLDIRAYTNGDFHVTGAVQISITGRGKPSAASQTTLRDISSLRSDSGPSATATRPRPFSPPRARIVELYIL